MATDEKSQDKGSYDEKQNITGDVVKRKIVEDAEEELIHHSAPSDKKRKKASSSDAPGSSESAKLSGISIKVGQLKSAETSQKKVSVLTRPKKASVAAAFNDESDEEEEIPREAKMRMRNLGKDTITSSGPNSFNKGKQGFTNHNKLREKELKLVKH